MKHLFMYSKRTKASDETPITVYEKLVGQGNGFLLESNDEIKGRYSFLGRQEEPYFYDASPEKIQAFLKEYTIVSSEEIPFVGGLVGMISYDVAKEVEDIKTINPDTLELPATAFYLVTEFIAFDHQKKEILMILLSEEENEEASMRTLEKLEKEIFKAGKDKENLGFRDEEQRKEGKDLKVCYHTSKESFIEKVKKAKEYIEAGDIFQVVLSQRISIEMNEKPFDIYKVLREVNPSPYLFYFNFGEFQVLGSSPESMVEVRNGYVSTCPIAGTIPRGIDAEEDEKRKQELLRDEKERAEHCMLVDLARNDIGKISKIGTVEIPVFMTVEKFSHVMHIVSIVKGQLKEQYDGVDAILSILPAGTLSGAPKIRAMEIIEELEEEKRGLYGGTIGYFGFDGMMDTSIAIRMVVCKGEKAYLQAGAGIVLESIPEKEYEETLHKASALITALQGEKKHDINN